MQYAPSQKLKVKCLFQLPSGVIWSQPTAAPKSECVRDDRISYWLGWDIYISLLARLWDELDMIRLPLCADPSLLGERKKMEERPRSPAKCWICSERLRLLRDDWLRIGWVRIDGARIGWLCSDWLCIDWFCIAWFCIDWLRSAWTELSQSVCIHLALY